MMWIFRVYVLTLCDGSLYVGSTAHPLAHRTHQHRVGGRLAARPCRRIGVRSLNRTLTPKRTYPTRDAAECAERALAQRLQRRFPKRHVYQH